MRLLRGVRERMEVGKERETWKKVARVSVSDGYGYRPRTERGWSRLISVRPEGDEK
jgi:hypothetical protein